jgi:nitroreductase/phosphoglycolate phosphatase-like HAD superfamily hydrolase
MQLETIPAKRLELFLDDGGVLNDNRLRRPEWVRLIGEFMPPRLGSTGKEWVSANQAVMAGHWLDLLPAPMSTYQTQREFHAAYALSWMSKMCARVGVVCPADDEAVALYTELSIYVAERADAAIEGAAAAVRSLHDAGYTLRMASGTASWELRGILGRMGILDAFSGLYGPDLIDCVKHGAAYYERLFAHAGVAPQRALVIESDAECCAWAREAGAQAVWVEQDGAGDVRTLAALARCLVEEGAYMQFEEFADHLSRQRAIRAFDTARDIDDATVEKLLRVAVSAPSGGNRQPWRFVVIRDPAIKQGLAALYREETMKYLGGREPEGQTSWADVPVLIAVCTEGQSAGLVAASIYPAIQNLLLAVHTAGLGSVLTTLWMGQLDAVKKLLDIPDGVQMHAILPIGYPDRKYGRGNRKPVAEVAFRDKYGQGW